jgi:hypothetical protein
METDPCAGAIRSARCAVRTGVIKSGNHSMSACREILVLQVLGHVRSSGGGFPRQMPVAASPIVVGAVNPCQRGIRAFSQLLPGNEKVIRRKTNVLSVSLAWFYRLKT